MLVRSLLSLVVIFACWFGIFSSQTFAATIGIHGIQSQESIKDLTRWESLQDGKKIDIIGLIFDTYTTKESEYLHKVVEILGTDRIYHISISPYGYTAEQVAQGMYDEAYDRFFTDVKKLGIKVVFRTMHEMNGGRYSRASHPEAFKQARIWVYEKARVGHGLQSDTLLFSLSFNSQDLPTTDPIPTQQSSYSYCSAWRIKVKGRCPRMEDYFPGSQYVDLIGVTLYNWGRSRADYWSQWKSASYLVREANLFNRLSQRNKPIIIDELGSTAINFSGKWTAERARHSFLTNDQDKTRWLQEWKQIIQEYPQLVGIVYFNVDQTNGATKSVLGQADWSLILSLHKPDYAEGKAFLLDYGDDALRKLFTIKYRPKRRDQITQ